MNLKNKKILFIGPVTYTYHTEIYNELINMGAKVDFFGENTLAFLYRATKKFNKHLFNLHVKKFRNKIDKKANEIQYDYIFLIRGDFLSKGFLHQIKCKQKTAKFLMYQWDSVKVFNYLDLIDVFDTVYSFDREDCKQNGFEYLPLFYDNDYKNIRNLNEPIEFDLLFVGSLHSDRLQILKELDAQAKEHGLTIKFLLYMPFFTFLKNFLFTKDFSFDMKYMIFKPIDKRALLDLFAKSKVIVDINNTSQSGLTMRTIETLGAGKKLLTTNKSILNDAFYCEQDINIIDRNKPKLDIQFIDSKNPANYYDKLQINSFLQAFFR